MLMLKSPNAPKTDDTSPEQMSEEHVLVNALRAVLEGIVTVILVSENSQEWKS